MRRVLLNSYGKPFGVMDADTMQPVPDVVSITLNHTIGNPMLVVLEFKIVEPRLPGQPTSLFGNIQHETETAEFAGFQPDVKTDASAAIQIFDSYNVSPPMTGWRSSNTSLPNPDQPVIVATRDGHVYSTHFHSADDEDATRWMYLNACVVVDYWMPSPPHPALARLKPETATDTAAAVTKFHEHTPVIQR